MAQAFHVLLGQEARGELPHEPDLVVALDEDLDDPPGRDALARRGFDDGPAALASVQRLRRVLGAARLEEGPGPSAIALQLLQGAARSPDPDQALFYLAEFAAALSVPAGYLRLLHQRPAVARRLLDLFGQSAYLSAELVRTPELLDQLVSWDAEALHKPPERIRSELDGRAARATEDPEQLLGALRRFKNEEVLRVGLGDIAGELEVPEVARQLTALADGLLDHAVLVAAEHARSRWGLPRMRDGRRAPLAVLGMGKLGGRELGYHSDLDLLFVYGSSADEETTGGHAGAHRAPRVLRPDGAAAPLPAHAAVPGGPAVPGGHPAPALGEPGPAGGERGVAARAPRPAGPALGAAGAGEGPGSGRRRELRASGSWPRALGPLVWERPLPDDAAEEIHRLRMRMEREVAGESKRAAQPQDRPGRPGGRGVRRPVPPARARRRRSRRCASPGRWRRWRRSPPRAGCAGRTPRGSGRGYLFLRRVENRQRLVHGRPLQHLPTRGRPLLLLARRLGYGGPDAGGAFLSEYRAVAATVRAAYVRVLQQ